MILNIYGTNPPPGTYTLADDGEPSIRMGQRFYRYGGLLPEARLVGGRVWLPSVPPSAEKIRIMAWTTTSSLTGVPDRTVEVPISGTGWNAGIFAEPVDLPADGQAFLIGYEFVGGVAKSDDYYVFSGNYRATMTPVLPSPVNGLAAAEQPLLFRIGAGAAQTGNAEVGYGIDVLVDDGEAVPDPNNPPVANAGIDQSGLTGQQVTLTGTATDPDGTIIGYAWTQVSGPAVTLAGSGATRTFTPATAGLRVFRLTVTDDDGATATDDVAITTTAPVVIDPPDPGPGSDENPADMLMAGLLLFLNCIAESLYDICTHSITIGDSYVPFRPDSEDEDSEDCEADCNQLWLRVIDITPKPTETWDGACAVTKVVSVEVGVLRCFGIPEGGEAPRASDVLAAANQSMQDSQAIFCAAMNCDAVEDLWISLNAGQWIPMGPMGGQYGGFWTFDIETD